MGEETKQGVRPSASGKQLLAVEKVTVRFGGIVALDSVSFDIDDGQVCGLIGPNGAGKTTLFNCLSRLYNCNEGQIQFDGVELTKLPCNDMAALGIGRTFQNLALFKTMTVRQNVMIGRHCRTRGGFLANALNTGAVRREEQETEAQANQLLTLLDLHPVAEIPVAALPFGTQKRVEFARALAAKPKLLLLDEPAAGLNHEEVSALGDLIRAVRDKLGVTVLLVEHHMSLVMGVSDKVVALNFGCKIAEGKPDHVRQHPDVIQAYLGAPAQ